MRKRPDHGIGLRPWIPKKPLELLHARLNLPLTRTSPCEACSAFTRVAASRRTAVSLCVTSYTEGFSHFVHLHDCSGCFWLERCAGWGSHPLESAAFFTAHALVQFPLGAPMTSKA